MHENESATWHLRYRFVVVIVVVVGFSDFGALNNTDHDYDHDHDHELCCPIFS